MWPHLSPMFSLSTVVAVFLFLDSASADISCYECDSSHNFTCNEFWDPTQHVNELYRTNCRHVFEAYYCIKMTGIFEGKLGTKRFCSSRNWGNYCEYISRPGDIQEYRSCVFSCSTNDCNRGVGSAAASASIVFLAAVLATAGISWS